MSAAELDEAAVRDRAQFWATRAPSTIGHLYDTRAIEFAKEVLAALDEITRLRAALDEAREDAASKARWIARAKEREDVTLARAEAAEYALAAVRALLDQRDSDERGPRWVVNRLRAALAYDAEPHGGGGRAGSTSNGAQTAALATPTTTDEGGDRG